MSIKNTSGLSESVFSSKSGEYDRHYQELKSRYSKEKRERLRLALKNISSDSVQNQIVDIGCGTAILLTKLLDEGKALGYVGVDSSIGMLEVAKEKVSKDYPNFFAEFFNDTLELGARKFDYVVSLGVIGYQENHMTFLNQLSGLLSQGGDSRIIMTCGNGSSFIRKLLEFIQSKRHLNKLLYRYTPSNLIKLWLHDKELRVSERQFLLPILPLLPVVYRGDRKIIQMFYMTQFLVVSKANVH